MKVRRPSVAAVLVLMVAGCGGTSTPSPTAAATTAPTAIPTIAPTATPTATPTASANGGPLAQVAALTFPPCPDPVCVGHGTKFTTCDSGLTAATPNPTDRFGLCPFTARLKHQVSLDSQGGDAGGGPADPIGGGQDPEWPTETITTTATATGGIAEVIFVDGANTFKTDLVIVSSGGTLLVDDIYCAGTTPSTSDAYVSGWDLRAVCSA